MTDKKPFVHELKAADFFLEPPIDSMSATGVRHGKPWKPMEAFPHDRTVEVYGPDDRIHVVAWIEGRGIVGGEDYPGEPKCWRERS